MLVKLIYPRSLQERRWRRVLVPIMRIPSAAVDIVYLQGSVQIWQAKTLPISWQFRHGPFKLASGPRLRGSIYPVLARVVNEAYGGDCESMLGVYSRK